MKTTDLIPMVLPAEADARTDGQLLRQFLDARDEQAFAELVQRHAAMVLGVCRRILGNVADAEDAFQATFLVLVRKAASLAGRAVVGDWLHGVARHTALKALAMSRRKRAKERTMARPEASVDDTHDDWLPLLDEELSRLPAKYREVIVLCELEGKTRREVAQQLRCPEGTIAGRLARGRALLARRLLHRGAALTASSLAVVLANQASAAQVSAALVASTARAGTLFSVGKATVAVISSQVASLTEGVLKTMLLRKTLITTVLTLVFVLTSGTLVCTLLARGQTSDDGNVLPELAAHVGADDLPNVYRQASNVSKEEKPPKDDAFDVKPDPAEKVTGPFDLKTSVPLPFMGNLIFPATPGPFVAVGAAAGAKSNGLKIYDLRTMKQTGETIDGKFSAFEHSRGTLSPDGAYLAARPKATAKPTVDVWRVATGKCTHLEIDSDPKQKVTWFAFAGKDRLLTMKHENEFADPETQATYQVWDLNTNKAVVEFTHDLHFHPKWGSLSPNGRYLVLEETTPGYLITFWDLETGKKAGSFAFQKKDDPWGQAAGMAFSPDGEELAMLWRLKKGDCWGRLICWETKTGKKLLDHKVGSELKQVESLWSDGGAKCLVWVPDRSGWLLFGHLLIDRESGKIVHRLGTEPKWTGEIIERRFLDRDHVTTCEGGFDKTLKVLELPREQIDAAVKEARRQSTKQ